ncbi:hypothetical protein LL253_00250 [Sphingobium soli]|uniref:WcbD n=1 Tax=Sphingobium soli TaxID=1591116 RepID=A0ABS8GXV5_9SPHN|nr:hypothetical protein [Sphingobium soli]MCC4231115.1 hypothetical protein [Sphingobium soli]
MLKIPDRVGRVPTLFIASVLIPTAIAILYYSLSSSLYISESHFVVRNSDKSDVSGLSSLIKSGGSSGNEGYATQDYILSRDALTTLNKNGLVTRAYGNDSISILNRFNPFGSGGSFDKLFQYYTNKVEVAYNAGSSITTLKVRAFAPKDAYEINRRLLAQAETLVNQLNQRSRGDLIGYASKELEEAKSASRQAALALSNYRNLKGVVDPEQQANVQLQMVSKLQDEMITTKTQLVQLRAFTPQNPQIPVLESRVRQLNKEIDEQTGIVAGNQKSLAATAAQYQRLQLESQLADKVLASAITSLQDARNEARRKRAYVERIVEPNMPDYPSEPRRMRAILGVFAVGMVVWAILSMLVSGIKEHKD